MNKDEQIINRLQDKKYEAGFTTDIEMDISPPFMLKKTVLNAKRVNKIGIPAPLNP